MMKGISIVWSRSGIEKKKESLALAVTHRAVLSRGSDISKLSFFAYTSIDRLGPAHAKKEIELHNVHNVKGHS
jgi:hypothetical protein